MIDRDARLQAAKAVQRFLDCETTNEDYISEYPSPGQFRWKGKDPAIWAIDDFSWNWYDDFDTHRLEGYYQLPQEARAISRRCVLFLKSDFEYEWRKVNFICMGIHILDILRLGRRHKPVTLDEKLAAHLAQPEGNAPVWPFFRISDYHAVLKANGLFE
jgi:hypothetical protein